MKLSKIFLSETTRPRAFIFGIQHHLEVLYKSCSNYAPHQYLIILVSHFFKSEQLYESDLLKPIKLYHVLYYCCPMEICYYCLRGIFSDHYTDVPATLCILFLNHLKTLFGCTFNSPFCHLDKEFFFNLQPNINKPLTDHIVVPTSHCCSLSSFRRLDWSRAPFHQYNKAFHDIYFYYIPINDLYTIQANKYNRPDSQRWL